MIEIQRPKGSYGAFTGTTFPQEVIGIFGQDEGVPLGTGTVINFTGGNVTASLSGTVINVNVTASAGEAFPVGSVFIGVVSTNPATLLGYGTWAAFGGGRVLVGFDSGNSNFDAAEKTGGSGTHSHANHVVTQPSAHSSHTHDYTQVPNHVHVENAPSSASGGAVLFALDTNASGSTSAGISTANPTGGVPTGTTIGPNASLTHAGTAVDAHSTSTTIMPYITVYMWKRTA